MSQGALGPKKAGREHPHAVNIVSKGKGRPKRSGNAGAALAMAATQSSAEAKKANLGRVAARRGSAAQPLEFALCGPHSWELSTQCRKRPRSMCIDEPASDHLGGWDMPGVTVREYKACQGTLWRTGEEWVRMTIRTWQGHSDHLAQATWFCASLSL